MPDIGIPAGIPYFSGPDLQSTQGQAAENDIIQ
jgi:hypothetical protein